MKPPPTCLPGAWRREKTMLNELIYDSELLAGGWIMLAIMGLSCVMWSLILDRYLFLWRGEKKFRESILSQWRGQACGRQHPLVKQRLRKGITAAFQARLSNWLGTIQLITAVLPLLGLLGTVTGMIKTFDVMTVFGSGNVRGMAEGISQALITTMAGLLTALTGMFFSGDLNQRIARLTEKFSEYLTDDSIMKGVKR
jgi:biopolymer transport protein ExbB